MQPIPENASGYGTLYVCATPIGTIDDASVRLRNVLANVEVIACEDTRTCRRLLSALGIPAPTLITCHGDNEHAALVRVCEALTEGRDVALVSDAGTPAISDPGAVVVAGVREAGLPVRSIPGPSSLAAALSVSGVTQSRHSFVAFLPRKRGELLQLIREHAHDVVVAFESPQRLPATLAAWAEEQPTRTIAVCRELGKKFEEVVVGTPAELAEWALAGVRGEIVLVAHALAREGRAAGAQEVDPQHVAAVHELREMGVGARDACRVIASVTAASARDLYQAAHDTPS